MRANALLYRAATLSAVVLCAGCQTLLPWTEVEQQRPPRVVNVDGEEASRELLAEVKARRQNAAVAASERITDVPLASNGVAPLVDDEAIADARPVVSGNQPASVGTTSSRRSKFVRTLEEQAEDAPPDPATRVEPASHAEPAERPIETTPVEVSTQPSAPRRDVKVRSTKRIRLKGVSTDARGNSVALLQVDDGDTIFAKHGDAITLDSDIADTDTTEQTLIVSRIGPKSVDLDDESTNEIVRVR